MCKNLGPVDSWIVKLSNAIGFVKGCFHPLPFLFFVPRYVEGMKIWSIADALSKLRPDEVLIKRCRCLGHRKALFVDSRRVSIISPLEAVKGLKECSTAICKAARDLVEYISTVTDLVGITGGLAYNPRTASDIDVVVFGSRIDDVYKLLVEMRKEGITKPYSGTGHAWSHEDMKLHNLLSRRRVLIGMYNGFEYNVRLIYCCRPAHCTPFKLLGEAEIRARILSSTNYSTPSIYLLSVVSIKGKYWENILPNKLYMLTYRIRYMEIPNNAVIDIMGSLEEQEGLIRIVPDHDGFVKLVSMHS
ncbi:hypothetical protein PYJP_04450 [Pyrofollis japonicus]|uniref:hypothetical protein n=1 Tax=Pyrofollis japonicus TaxID=3060460 RepID=UPI00295AF49C|nr:hypothetical protein [Pyrofollis japonicus]BEP17093.1 hypothetical protein PYJP_04450 [Pyrofollis japonicus]